MRCRDLESEPSAFAASLPSSAAVEKSPGPSWPQVLGLQAGNDCECPLTGASMVTQGHSGMRVLEGIDAFQLFACSWTSEVLYAKTQG